MGTIGVWLVVVWAGVARADAIEPFEGECPPGLRETIGGHAEICEPIACARDGECGDGAACRPIAECWAPRPYDPSGGRIAPSADRPYEVRDQVIGRCRPDGTCAEGRCETRRQCEPTGSTPAWDPAARRWTGEPHRASSCSVGGASPPAAAALALALAAWLARRPDRRARARRAGLAKRAC